MNSTTADLRNGGPPDLAIDPLHALMLATLGGGLVYLSFFRGIHNKQRALEADRDDIFPAAYPESRILCEKDLSFPEIQPLGAFPAPPPKFRPYTTQFTKSLALQSSPPEDLLLIDNLYRQRLAYRRSLLLNHPSATYGSIPTAAPAVSELYTYLISHHLPSRFPRHFSKSPSGTLVQNHTNSNTYPIISQSSTNALRGLAENIDDDFIVLLPPSAACTGWTVGAFVTCFPNGFSLATKLGDSQSEDRVFARLAPGVSNSVKRLNWSVVKTDNLFQPQKGNHIFDEDTEEESKERAVDPVKCCLRVERQTMWKLPVSGAVVLGVKTYLTSLKEIREEGEGCGLAEAVERESQDSGRPLGGWGEAVVEYLRN